jgi:cell wall-associated NlpC family hydrolase
LPTALLVTRALEWATARRGDPSYAGRCLAFVEDAFERANQIEVFGEASAAEAAAALDLARYEAAHPPAAGSLVFFACGGPLNGVEREWGHVGIALGDGRVVHAWDVVRIDDALEIPRLGPAPGWSAARLIGWASAGRLLRDHRPRDWGEAAG